MAAYPTIEGLLSRRLPLGLRPVSFLVSLLILVAGGFAALSDIEEVVTVPGSLIWSSPKIVISSPELAVVESTVADVSEPVAAGGTLATVRLLQAEADHRSLQAEAIQLLVRIDRLSAERSGHRMPIEPTDSFLLAIGALAPLDIDPMIAWEEQQALSESRLRLHDSARLAIEDAIANLDRQIAASVVTTEAHKARLPVFNQIEEMKQTLAKTDVGSELSVLEAIDERLAAELAVAASLRDTAEAETDRVREVGRLKALDRERLAEIDRDLDEARVARAVTVERLAVASARAELTRVVAPVDVIVLERADRAPGSVVQAGEHLFTMIPKSGTPKVRLIIPAADIARLKGDEAVRIKFESLPFQRHGYLTGRIESISTDAVLSTSPAGVQAPVYYANAGIDPGQHLANVPADFRLLPGMPLTAEVLVGRRPLYTYFTYPLEQVAARALREDEVGSK